MGEWIKCSERLPEEKAIAVAIKRASYGEVRPGWYSRGTIQEQFWDYRVNDIADDVTHWQPLPPPPTQESDDDE